MKNFHQFFAPLVRAGASNALTVTTRLDELFAWLGWLWLVVRSFVASAPFLTARDSMSRSEPTDQS